MRRLRTTLLIALTTLCAAGSAAASSRYDPRLQFRTITTPHFDIHFHQGEESQARRLAVIAEDVARVLETRLGRPASRVDVILVNQSDAPNGWATPVPFNLIEVAVAAPTGDSMIGNTDDWLRLVFTHEYTHIVHLSRSRGWIGGLRHVFGRMPLLFPNLFTPIWQIEGIATFEESALTDGGRVNAPDFRVIAEKSASSGLLSLDRASGGLIQWPSGNAPYAYGSFFHEFLAKQYGDESLRRLADATSGRFPYFGSTAYRGVFGKSLGDLWKEFAADLAREEAATNAPASRKLTNHGFNVTGPRFGPGGRIYYSIANPHEFPALMATSLDQSRSERVALRYLGSRIGFSGSTIIFDRHELVRNVGLQSDLFAVPAAGGAARRLTREARLADPDVSPDGRTIVCTQQRADGRGLVLLPFASDRGVGAVQLLTGESFTDWSSPRWSPDGRWIAAERRSHGRPSEIVIVDPRTGAVRTLLSSSSARNVTPAWTPDSARVLFASDRSESGFAIFAVALDTGVVTKLQGTVANAQSPDISPDGQTLVYVGYTERGYDLFSIDLTVASWTNGALESEPLSESLATTSPDVASHPYSPWPTLAPRFWTPTFESDAGELVVGAATGGYDALGRHAYGVEGGWSTARARPDWQVAYAYDRWWPTMFADVSDDTDPFRDGDVRTLEANAGVLLPFRRVRWSQSLLGAFHVSRDRLACSTCGPQGEIEATRSALRGGWLVDAARSYGYSIGDEEGWRAVARTEFSRQALGADGDGGAAILDLRGYVPLGSRHAVLAARAAGATTWGDDAVRRLFSASGNGPPPLGFAFGTDAIALLRGVGDGVVAGEHAAVVNVDVRVPLWRIERGVGTWPFFARTLHGSVFADFGHAWDKDFRRADISRSFGGELSIDAVVGYSLPLTFTAGAAWRDVPGVERGATAFARVGRAF
jgi:Tol biopolymer transport system component